MSVARRGRRPIMEGQRLEPVATGVDPETYRRIKVVAEQRGVPIAVVLRSVLTVAFSYKKASPAEPVAP